MNRDSSPDDTLDVKEADLIRGGVLLVAQMQQHHSLFSSLFPKPDPGGPGCLRIQFVIVSGPFLAVAVKPISSGTTAKMTLGGFLKSGSVVMGKPGSIYSRLKCLQHGVTYILKNAAQSGRRGQPSVTVGNPGGL